MFFPRALFLFLFSYFLRVFFSLEDISPFPGFCWVSDPPLSSFPPLLCPSPAPSSKKGMFLFGRCLSNPRFLLFPALYPASVNHFIGLAVRFFGLRYSGFQVSVKSQPPSFFPAPIYFVQLLLGALSSKIGVTLGLPPPDLSMSFLPPFFSFPRMFRRCTLKSLPD